MTQFLVDLVGRFGYLIVFLGVGVESMGVPVPGETALVIGAVLAAQGRLNPVAVALVAWAAAVIGDNIGYAVGRRYGHRLVRMPGVRRLYDERRLAVGERFFARWGVFAVFFGRFVAILRIFAGPLAGMNRMRWPLFLVANAAGGAIWVGAVVTVGLLVGSNLDRAVSLVASAGYIGLGLAVVVVVGGFGLHLRRSQRELHEGERLLAERGEGPTAGPDHP